MALFLIERNFAEELNVTPEIAAAVKQVNMEVGINWLFSFLSADKRKTYCLYEAQNPEAIREAAKRLNAPADVIVELGDMRITPDSSKLLTPTPLEGPSLWELAFAAAR
jgi:hypothetical protein